MELDYIIQQEYKLLLKSGMFWEFFPNFSGKWEEDKEEFIQFYNHRESLKQKKIMENREFTFGEKLVGLTFNPSGDEKVQKAKELCAALADLLNESYNNPMPPKEEHRPLYELLFQKAIGDILDAQMNAVKVLTFKY